MGSWFVDQLSTAVDDNPAQFFDIDSSTGEFIVAFRTAKEDYKKVKARLARHSPLLGENRIRAIQLLTETYHEHFSAYLNEQGELEMIVLDKDLKQEVSFNEKLRKHLQEQ